MPSAETSKQTHESFELFQPPPFLPTASDISERSAPPPTVDYASAGSLFKKFSLQDSTPTAAPAVEPSATVSTQSGYDPVSKLSSRSIRPLPRSASGSGSGSTRPSEQHTFAFPSPPRLPPRQHPSSDPVTNRGDPVRAPLPPQSEPLDPPRSSFQSLKQQGEAAHRRTEADRRNKVREEEKIQRQKDLQSQKDRNFEAVRMDKEAERVELLVQQEGCARAALRLAPTAAFAWDQPVGPLDPDEAIGRQVRVHWETTRPSAQSLQSRQRVVKRIQAAIDSRWPGFGLKVAPFGSSVTGLVSDRSDLDLVLLDPTKPFGVGTPHFLEVAPLRRVCQIDGMPDWYNVRVVAAALKSDNSKPGRPEWFKNVTAISGANVPIIKFVDAETGIPADLNINERFGLINSQLIETYANLQPDLFRPCVFFLKHWLSRRGLNDPSGSKGPISLSSYTIALMAIQYFQVRGLLPNLQDPKMIRELGIPRAFIWRKAKRGPRRRQGSSTPGYSNEPGPGYDVTFAPLVSSFYRDEAHRNIVVAGRSVQAPSDKLLGQTVVGFFDYYCSFSRQDLAISVVNGRPLELLESGGSLGQASSSSQRSRPVSASSDPSSTECSDDADGTLAAAQREAAPPGVLAMDHFRQPEEWVKQELVVQDPFIVDRNTARNIGNMVAARLEKELQRAKQLLSSTLMDGSTACDLPLICDACTPLWMKATGVRAGDAFTRASRGSRPNAGNPTNPAATKLNRSSGESTKGFSRKEAGMLGLGHERSTMVDDEALRKKEDALEAKRLKAKRNAERKRYKEQLRKETAEALADRERAQLQRANQPAPSAFTMRRDAANGGGGGDGHQAVSPNLSAASESSEDVDLVALRLERAKRQQQPRRS